MSTPEVRDMSCVIVCGDDAEALRATVGSVLGQTLAGTEAVLVATGANETAASLAAGDPQRIRLVHAGTGSHGDLLRDLGLAAARGRYVMVAAPGERLERHACRNLLEAALRTDADLVAGRWEKGPGRYKDLYARSRVTEDLADAPELVASDALAAGFCVRRAALGTLSDTGEALFGVRAALAARRIALVPNLIVTGRAPAAPVRDLPRAARVQRATVELLRHDDTLRAAREKTFLTDHVVPCVRAFLPLGPDGRREAAATLAESLRGLVTPEALRTLPPVERVGVRLLADGDADGVRAAAYALARPGTVVSPLVRTGDGRVRWSAEHAGDDTFDVTELGHQYGQFTDLKLLNQVTHCLREGAVLAVGGRVVVPLGLLDHGPVLAARLDLTVRGGGARLYSVPVGDLRKEDGGIVWRAEVPLTGALRPRGIGDRVWDPRLVLTVDGVPVTTELLADKATVPAGATALPARPRLTRLTADTWQPYVTAGHHLAVCLLPRRRPARAAHALLHYVTHFRPARELKPVLRALGKKREALHSKRVKTRVYRRILTRLPVSRGLVVFESHMGKSYGDSPRAVHEELLARGARPRCVWSYATSPAGFPAGARLVRRWSWRYLWALARAEWWVDNQGFPHALDKPRHTRYLQTWHGSAYKRMGFDEPRHATQNAPQRDALARAVGRFDHFMVRSEHDVRTLARAYRIPEEKLLRAGYPRNDRLVAARARDEREGRFPRPAPATELGIPDHRTVVLYAPTFRGLPKDGRTVELPLDVREFAERFGDTHVLLVRAHYMEAASLPATPPGTVIDVSGHHDVQELLVLADVLITDYSSIMFDYALLDRPLVHFAPDLDAYAAERGAYFDLRARAAGPVAETQEELLRTLDGLKEADGEWQAARRAFAAEFGTYDDGGAARAAADLILGVKEPRA
ncbi:CDP-glycerol:glycerophosphate glycerophosphotransferase [Streptomyces antnestii]|uniref:CDP-glycerol:glycerophosphate glycerophosphotransferase n=1 Tax=Streptomyces antnestii TaxID=2494256 RepID=A0A3S2VIA0_9ACTN|nr:CDP-glycerol glycerophosphotransferase family protein [Streptomyces sp. San01]RVU24521.1 CDP-glycerol:glycerophosphate glycerophosphotransferase [Streptomyces sp. San01]